MCRTTAKKLSSSDVSTSRDWLDDIAGLETHKGVGSAWLKRQPCALAPRPVILAGTASAGVYQDCYLEGTFAGLCHRCPASSSCSTVHKLYPALAAMFRPIARIAAPPCCSTSGRRHSAAQGQPALVWHEPSSQRRRPTHVCRASEDVQADDKDAAAEARLEAYERGAKRRQGALLVCAQASSPVLLHQCAPPSVTASYRCCVCLHSAVGGTPPQCCSRCLPACHECRTLTQRLMHNWTSVGVSRGYSVALQTSV